jgi:coiled-coil domain-containing protein 130
MRFEMPFNIWCGGCKNQIGMGVRFNAEKKQAGTYFSSKIWNFRMKCAQCSNWIEIETDPQVPPPIINEN